MGSIDVKVNHNKNEVTFHLLLSDDAGVQRIDLNCNMEDNNYETEFTHGREGREIIFKLRKKQVPVSVKYDGMDLTLVTASDKEDQSVTIEGVSCVPTHSQSVANLNDFVSESEDEIRKSAVVRGEFGGSLEEWNSQRLLAGSNSFAAKRESLEYLNHSLVADTHAGSCDEGEESFSHAKWKSTVENRNDFGSEEDENRKSVVVGGESDGFLEEWNGQRFIIGSNSFAAEREREEYWNHSLVAETHAGSCDEGEESFSHANWKSTVENRNDFGSENEDGMNAVKRAELFGSLEDYENMEGGGCMKQEKLKPITDTINKMKCVDDHNERIARIDEFIRELDSFIGFSLSIRGEVKRAEIIIDGVDQNGRSYFTDRFGTRRRPPKVHAIQDYTLHYAYERGSRTFLSFYRPFVTCDSEQDQGRLTPSDLDLRAKG
ncbi:unnamed protein product [Orchesella dallaii]|uniref:DOMON domain-containing protein n=1 Tax=Orchesella dallaii TaxID=48710 RepID=A0ABP1QA19_9HEXA